MHNTQVDNTEHYLTILEIKEQVDKNKQKYFRKYVRMREGLKKNQINKLYNKYCYSNILVYFNYLFPKFLSAVTTTKSINIIFNALYTIFE